MPGALDDVEQWLDLESPLDAIEPLGPDAFSVRPVNPAVNKVSVDVDAIEAPTEPETP
jgi:putative SOS response-associated peptidase YedK